MASIEPNVYKRVYKEADKLKKKVGNLIEGKNAEGKDVPIQFEVEFDKADDEIGRVSGEISLLEKQTVTGSSRKRCEREKGELKEKQKVLREEKRNWES